MKIKTNIMCIGLLLVSVLGLMSCSDANKKSVGDWGLKAPLFETSDKNELEKLQSFTSVTSSSEPVTLKPTDKIIFTDASFQEGVSLSMQTSCSRKDDQNTLTKSLRLGLAPKIAIYEFLPIELLYQPNGRIGTGMTCQVHIVATNKNGSTHDFGDSIKFTLGLPETSSLIPLESRTTQLPVGHSEGYLGVSKRDSYNVYLPALAAGQNFWLKCESFQTRTAQAKTLAEVLEQNKNSGDAKADELCRLFVESKGVIKNMSNFFMLMVFNVDNLVDNVEMSSPLVEKPSHAEGFRVATVTFFNKTNKVYYGQLLAPPIPVLTNKRVKTKNNISVIALQPAWDLKDKVFVLEPNKSLKVSLRIPLFELCRGAQIVQATINEQRPLPVIALSEADPRGKASVAIDLNIPMLEPSALPVSFDARPKRGTSGLSVLDQTPNCFPYGARINVRM